MRKTTLKEKCKAQYFNEMWQAKDSLTNQSKKTIQKMYKSVNKNLQMKYKTLKYIKNDEYYYENRPCFDKAAKFFYELDKNINLWQVDDRK